MRAADRRVTLGPYRVRPDRDLLRHALKLGVTAIDTAYNYDHFTSHRTLRQFARQPPGPVRDINQGRVLS